MRDLRKFVQRVGFVSTLLIGGVLGGLLTPLSSEALTISIDGKTLSLTPYPCESGYTSCSYLTSSGTAILDITGPTGTFKLTSATPTNRARVRINDRGGAPNTNVDKMNLTGIKLTPTTGGSKTIHIIMTHTFTTGQAAGNYQWGMGVTGQFTSTTPDTVLNNKFVLTGKGKFKTPNSNDPEVEIGKLDKGPFSSPQAPGANGVVTQTVNVKTVKTGCNSDSSGSCKPEIKYDFEVTFVGTDSLVLTDSVLSCGITCTDAQVDPEIPRTLRLLMLFIDRSGNVPTHISDLYDWIDEMAEKYRLNDKQLNKVNDLKNALAKWFANQTCPGKCQKELVNDSTSGVAQGLLAGGTPVTTCSDTNTCGTGTIVIRKTTSPNTIENFGFTGTGSGITDFGILTDQDVCDDGCMEGSQTFSLLQTDAAGGSRTITETVLPSGWSTTDVHCTNSDVENSTSFTTSYGGASSAYVTVHNLAAGDTLTCTFKNTKQAFNSDDYRVISSPGVSWTQAQAQAQSLSGGCWDLATITSAGEQAFIASLLGPPPTTGISQYWVGGFQPITSAEPGADWQWINGEGPIGGVGYSNWGGPPQQPDNATSSTNGVQNHVALDNRFDLPAGWGWDDNDTIILGIIRGYVAERVSCSD